MGFLGEITGTNGELEALAGEACTDFMSLKTPAWWRCGITGRSELSSLLFVNAKFSSNCNIFFRSKELFEGVVRRISQTHKIRETSIAQWSRMLMREFPHVFVGQHSNFVGRVQIFKVLRGGRFRPLKSPAAFCTAKNVGNPVPASSPGGRKASRAAAPGKF